MHLYPNNTSEENVLSSDLIRFWVGMQNGTATEKQFVVSNKVKDMTQQFYPSYLSKEKET